MKRKITQKIAKDFVRILGGTVTKTCAGDFRLSLLGERYYTDSLDDIIGTARAIAGTHKNIADAERVLTDNGVRL